MKSKPEVDDEGYSTTVEKYIEEDLAEVTVRSRRGGRRDDELSDERDSDTQDTQDMQDTEE